ncbi:MAG TPA: hypothetical protein VHY84_10215 [Bryobacteraceae bacterium]|jgi:hypothetical protein|nr:hypothetical protein [Bryobacteraceae bacterium]
MPHTRNVFYGFLAAALLFVPAAVGQSSSAAPAPKATHKAPTQADWAALGKLPDFTGVWEIPLGPPARGGAARGGAPGRGARGPRTGGGRGPANTPSLTPEYAAKAQEEARTAVKAEDNQSANCLPPGMPAIMSQPYPIEVLMTPGQVTIVVEAYEQVRHIYTDGRPLPEDPDPSFDGTSIGHWEGDTLVVETVGFEPVPRGINFPHSDKMKIVERFKLSDPDTLNVETSIVDPLALTKPFDMGNRIFKRHRSWTIAEYVCEENNRNFVDDKGKAGINLANPTASPK